MTCTSAARPARTPARTSRWTGRRRAALARWCAAAVATAPAVARAHHVPGQSASEGVRNINSLGGGAGQARSRLLVLQEIGRSSARRTLNPGTVYTTSLLGEFAPHPWFSFGVQAPLLVVDEDAQDVATKVGYGDTRVLLRLSPHADKLIHRVLSVGVNLSFPTRTVRFEADPGNIWIVAPSVLYSRTYRRAFWQAIGALTIEERPAGTALDVTAGMQAGYRFFDVLSPTLGVLADVRAFTACAEIGGGSSPCLDGRATEVDRETGSVRAYALAGLAWTFAPWGSLLANAQVPVTPRADFDVAGSVGLQFTF